MVGSFQALQVAFADLSIFQRREKENRSLTKVRFELLRPRRSAIDDDDKIIAPKSAA